MISWEMILEFKLNVRRMILRRPCILYIISVITSSALHLPQIFLISYLSKTLRSKKRSKVASGSISYIINLTGNKETTICELLEYY
jgi:hypothetical protein